jgi:hypothetical protein
MFAGSLQFFQQLNFASSQPNSHSPPSLRQAWHPPKLQDQAQGGLPTPLGNRIQFHTRKPLDLPAAKSHIWLARSTIRWGGQEPLLVGRVGEGYGALHATIASGRVRPPTDGGAKIAR